MRSVRSDQIIKRLTTKADRIRALARAGYLRAKIAELLDVRYQHVRNVLERSGIRGGLRSSRQPLPIARDPVAIGGPGKRRKPISPKVLVAAGFSQIGAWTKVPNGGIRLEGKAPAEPGVYAFVLDGTIVYIGLSSMGLRRRLDQYKRGNTGQRTSARVKALISEALGKGHAVTVLVTMPEPERWQGLPINVAAGLELGLIQELRPAWNILGAGA